jgi:hypothetical protein
MKNLAKRLGIISLVAVIGFSMAGCDGSSGDDGCGNVAVTGVSLNKTTLSLNAGETETLTASISPSNATNKRVAWNTSNPAVATVLPNGLVSGISFGTATISVTTDDGSITATCAVTVSAPVTSAELASRLASLPANTPDTPHTVSVIVSADGNVDEQFSVIKAALRGASNKYVYLDFSKSDMRSVPFQAFSTQVGENEYTGCNTLIGVNIPDSVTLIDKYAFTNCENLASVTLPPNGITDFLWMAFRNCTNLASIRLPDTLTFMEWNVFENTGLTSITIPDSVTRTDGWVFVGCSKLVNISIGKGLTKLLSGTFGYCYSYSSITIPANIKIIENEVFAGGNLTSVTFQGTIPASDFHPDAFKYQGSDLREKYLAGGIGTYTRANGEDETATWTKQ